MKQLPLVLRLYADPVYAALIQFVGYQGITYRDLCAKVEELAMQFGKPRVESATWTLLTFDGQFALHPPPLAHIALRPDVRRLAFQMLGPPPEKREEFDRPSVPLPSLGEPEPRRPTKRTRRKQ